MSDEQFLQRLRETFRGEAQEHIQSLDSLLRDLENAGAATEAARRDLIDAAFRRTHSLKGAARSVGAPEIESLCQTIEGVLAKGQKADFSLPPASTDTLRSASSLLNALLGQLGSPLPALLREQLNTVISKLEQLDAPAPGTASPAGPAVNSEASNAQPITPSQESFASPRDPYSKFLLSDTVRVSASRLNELKLQTEELLSFRAEIDDWRAQAAAIHKDLAAWQKEWAKAAANVPKLRLILKSLDLTAHREAENLLHFSEWTQQFLRSQERRLARLHDATAHGEWRFGQSLNDLLRASAETLMLPFDSLLAPLPAYARGPAREQGKDVEVRVTGAETEVDRRLLQNLRDVFLHLLHNALDHGIEHPKTREASGKSPRGAIDIVIQQISAVKVAIRFSDDGAGLDPAKLKEAAIDQGIISRPQAAQLTDTQALSLIFSSGLSTQSFVTGTSGRGMGLAIVRDTVDKLGGAIAIESTIGAGTALTIHLPTTVSRFRAVLIKAGGRLFALPETDIRIIKRERAEHVESFQDQPALRFDDRLYPLLPLSVVLDLTSASAPSTPAASWVVVLLESLDRRLALVVDEIVDEQEIFMKDLGPQLIRLRGLAGGMTLPSGEVAPVLSVTDLFAIAKSKSWNPSSIAEDAPSPRRKPQPSPLLLVEDSITTRSLLKTVLQGAGYEVLTAVDGAEAWAKAQTNEFAAVISDVEMPRMNGFDLTRSIRGHKKTEHLPVILITGLETREDQEKGIDAGANAYLVKTNFDQTRLLETVRRFV